MKTGLFLPTTSPNLALHELVNPEDDARFFELTEANRQHWKDLEGQFPDLEAVRERRLGADDEQELRLGMVVNSSLIGWESLITCDQGEKYDNWLGFWVDRQHTGQGYATLAAQAAIAYVRDNPALKRTIMTTTSPNNTPAIKVLERVGFRHAIGEELPEELGYVGQLVFRLSVDEA